LLTFHKTAISIYQNIKKEPPLLYFNYAMNETIWLVSFSLFWKNNFSKTKQFETHNYNNYLLTSKLTISKNTDNIEFILH